MLTIYDTKNNIRFETPINKGSKRVLELMADNYVTLVFSVSNPIYFELGDWCEIPNFGLFELVELYKPTYNKNTGGYDYELPLEAYYCKWRNKIFKYTPETGGREASWNLTATLDVHLGVFIRNLSALGYTYHGEEFIFSIDSTVEQSAKLLTYNNTDLLSALTIMSEAWECEWWIEDNVICFGRCEFGDPVDFEMGINVADMPSSPSKNTYATRIYAFGSTRNIPVNYRPVDESLVVNGIVQKRLMLPVGTPYVDAYPNMRTEEAVEQVVVFDEVYPRTDGYIDSITTYTDTVTNDDGTENTETFYRFKDDHIKFSQDYIIENEELHIIFQSGSLNGMDFGVAFNPLGVAEKLSDGDWNPEAQLWEVVANENYGRKLPDDILKPKIGDKYVLYGWNATKIADLGLIADAEQELLEKTQKYIDKTKIDPNTYSCVMMSDWIKAQGDTPQGFIMPFSLGDRINLKNKAYFPAGSRLSRIIGYECPLDFPYDSPVFTVGETASTSRLKALEETIETLTFKGQTFAGGGNGGTSIYLITTNDTTVPTNRNAFSALRSLREFVSKTKPDRTPYDLAVGGTLTAEDIVRCKEFMAGLMGWQIDKIGNAEFESGVFRSFLQIYELIVNRQRTIEGDVLMSEGDTIEEVIPLGVSDEGNERYTLKLHEEWEGYTTAQYEENVCKGIYNDITQRLEEAGEGETRLNNATYATSWFKVLAVRPESNEIDVVMYPDDEVPAGRNFAPRPMMKFARWGNAGSQEEQLRRQEVLYFSSTEGRIMKLFRVTKPIIDQGNVAMVMGTVPEFLADGVPGINPGENIGYFKTVIAERFVTSPYAGRPQALIVFRGDWDPDEMYYDGTEWVEDSGGYERSVVVYYGCQWICAKKGTQNHPSWDSVDWALYLGDPSLKLSWTGSEDSVYESNPEITLEAAASICYMDVTDDPQIKWDWERYSERDGVRDTADDDLWTAAHQNLGNRLELTVADMNYQFGKRPDKLAYKLTATLIDKNGLPATYTRGNPSDTMEVIF